MESRLDVDKVERLQTEYIANGHVYRLNLRNDVVALYNQFDKKTNELVGYELFEVLIRDEENIKGVHYNRREVKPSTSMWGTNAFTLSINRSESYIDEKFKKFTNEIRFRRRIKETQGQ